MGDYGLKHDLSSAVNPVASLARRCHSHPRRPIIVDARARPGVTWQGSLFANDRLPVNTLNFAKKGDRRRTQPDIEEKDRWIGAA